ncbi:MAG: hypothetical protein K2L05_02915, partial [Muribaculaceae bacterium]|nr:hypothetical protein [Muribaculaceae bacterium]
TLRYYSTNADNALDTHGDITLTFTAHRNANILEGHLRETDVEAGHYVLGMMTGKSRAAGDLGFVKLPATAAVKGNYVYIHSNKLSESTLATAEELPLVDRETTTDIQEINGQQHVGADVVFDLQGRRLTAPVKGFNIINGRKVFVK